MAAMKHVKAKGKWKKIELPSNAFIEDEFDNIVALEELKDYELSYSSPFTNTKSSICDIDDKVSDISTDEVKHKLTYKERRKLRAEANKKKRKKKRALKIKEQFEKKEENENNTATKVSQKKLSLKRKAEGKEIGVPEKKKKKKSGKKQKQNKNNYNAASVLPDILPPLEEFPPGMESWKNMFVPTQVLWALKDSGFVDPTSIQALTLPHAIRDKLDILGAAETGSGKTLAFGIPVLHQLLLNKEHDSEPVTETENTVTDTDELNTTDSEEEAEEKEEEDDYSEELVDMNEIMMNLENDEDDDGDEDVNEDDGDEDVDSGVDNGCDEDGQYDDPPTDEDLQDLGESEVGCVKVVHNIVLDPAVTVMKSDKPLIGLILEPTRELAIQVKNHMQKAAKYIDVRIATIVGGMAPQKQRRILSRCPEIIIATPGRLWELLQEGDPHLSKIPSAKVLVVDEADRMVEKGHFEELTKLLEFMKENQTDVKRQTFVFSATLTMIHKGPSRKLKKKKHFNPEDKLGMLMYQIGIKQQKKVIDLTTKTGTAETLTEGRINCLKEEKDLYLYYFHRKHPGRTLVFANSKDCIRRLVSIFTELGFHPFSLHADMHQKQRLKNLEKFSGSDESLLFASDVAARGLDIPNVHHVIHYQVPRTIENYVHRSGRTARASKEGLSVMLISEDDVRNYRKIIHTLNKDQELPVFPVEQQYIPVLKSHLTMAKEIDKSNHRFNKVKRQNDWFTKAAEEMDIDIEDENLLVDLGDQHEQRKHAQKLDSMRAQLKQMIKQPLTPRIFSSKYPTQMGKLVIPETKDMHSDALRKMKNEKVVQRPMIENIVLNPKVKKTKVNRQREKKKHRNPNK